MNINEDIRNKTKYRKMMNTISYISAANYFILPNLVPE